MLQLFGIFQNVAKSCQVHMRKRDRSFQDTEDNDLLEKKITPELTPELTLKLVNTGDNAELNLFFQ